MDSYKEIRTFNINNAVIRVHIPDLTAEERSKRMKTIHDAAANMMKGIERCEKGNSKTTA